ncbi:MAG: hypothetical protein KDE09_10505 [Anaerolineales bacterium]|nr:hypothetical protein [Anaerolineales bacterium]
MRKTINGMSLPWSDDFDQLLVRVGDTTWNYDDDDFLREMHREIIESKWIMMMFHARLKRLAYVIIALQVGCILTLLF